ncbi:MAG: hypothetical protein IKQ46_09450 [Bacteroidales bacterium]|nr:hypothetical protein [Bacteroidales bacterium]
MKLFGDVLICASCINELSEIKSFDTLDLKTGEVYNLSSDIDILITGVGAWLPVFTLQNVLLKKKYDLVIFVGICGEYDFDKDLCQLYVVSKTTFVDMGFEDENQNFVSIIGSRFFGDCDFGFQSGYLVNPLSEKFAMDYGLKAVTCNTVARCCTDEKRINFLTEKHHAQIETMESAAFAFVCLNLNQKFVELRCSSNYVLPKKQKKWQVKPAIAKLNEFLETYFF